MIRQGRQREVDWDGDKYVQLTLLVGAGCREKRAGQSTVGYAERTSLLVASLAVPQVFDDVTTGVAGNTIPPAVTCLRLGQ